MVVVVRRIVLVVVKALICFVVDVATLVVCVFVTVDRVSQIWVGNLDFSGVR